jgi:hypothetical protein
LFQRSRHAVRSTLVIMALVAMRTAEAQLVPPGPPGETGGAALPTPSAEAPRAGLFDGFVLRPGPVRLGGSLATDLRLSRSAGQPATFQQVENANVQAATWIWQPWFAQTRAGLGFVLSKAKTDADPATGNASYTSRGTSLTGDAALSLFPVSRFPFEAFASRTDSRLSGEIAGSDFNTTRVGLRQTYIDESGNTRYSGRYERNVLTSATFGRDTLDVFDASMHRRMGPHSFELNGNHSANSGGVAGVASVLDRLNGRHTWSPEQNLQVESLASANRTTLRGTGAVPSFTSRFGQFTTFASWRPEEGEPLFDEDHPLYLTATGRAFVLQNDGLGAGTEAKTLSGSLGANYTLSEFSRVTGSASVTHADSNGAVNLLSSQVASIVYTPPLRRFGAFSWTWSASGTASNATASAQPARQALSSQVSHNVLRSIELSPTARLNFNASQGVGAAFDSAASVTETLTHAAGATWIVAAESGAQSYVGLSVADARSFGANASALQLVNLQASRQNTLSRTSYWAGNLTAQATRQSTADSSSGVNITTTGNLSYFHNRVFGVPRLRFSSTLTLATQQFDSRVAGDLTARREHVSSALEGRFDYTIGRVDVRLTARTATIDGRANHLLFLRVVRQFGAF